MIAIAFHTMPMGELSQWLYVEFRADGPAHPFLISADAIWADKRGR